MNKKTRLFVYTIVSLLTVAGMFWYVNTYIYNFFAATAKVSVTLTPSKQSVSPNDEFVVSFLAGNQNMDALDLYLSYDSSKVEYFTEYAATLVPGTGYTQIPEGYYTDPVIEEIQKVNGKKQLHLVLISLSTTRQKNIQLNFKFRALNTSSGEAVFTLEQKSRVAGVDDTNNAVYFENDPTSPSTTVTISSVGVTPSISVSPIISGSITPTVPVVSPSVSISPSTTVSPVITDTITPTEPITSPTPTDEPVQISLPPNIPLIDATIKMKIRFQGVTNPTAENTKQIVEVGTGAYTGSAKKVEFTHEGNGVWVGTVILKNAYPYGYYAFYIKGPKHLRKKVCDSAPSENLPGTYKCRYGNIQITEGENILDFSNIILLAGDLPNQDGMINSLDYTFIRQNFGSKDAEVLKRGDLNMDGIIHTDDHTLIKTALEFKYDEE